MQEAPASITYLIFDKSDMHAAHGHMSYWKDVKGCTQVLEKLHESTTWRRFCAPARCEASMPAHRLHKSFIHRGIARNSPY